MAPKKRPEAHRADCKVEGEAVVRALNRTFGDKKLFPNGQPVVLPRLELNGAGAGQEKYGEATHRRCTEPTLQDALVAALIKDIGLAMPSRSTLVAASIQQRVHGVLLLQKAISPQCPCVKLMTRHTKVLAKRIVRAEQQGTAVAAASIRRSQHAGAGQMAKSEPIVAAAAALTIQRQPLPPAQPPHPPPPPPPPANDAAVDVWMDPDDEDELRDRAGRLGLGLGVTDDIEMRRQSLEGVV